MAGSKVTGPGKTTALMEKAVSKLAFLDEDEYVFITGPHTPWLKRLERDFKDAGLVGVKFMTVQQIKDGKLRGYRGALLIDDIEGVHWTEVEILMAEQHMLSARRLQCKNTFRLR